MRYMDKAVFLDRDGVINELAFHKQLDSWNAPFNLEEYKMLPGVGDAINQLHQHGYKVIVVSNQPNIAHGQMSHQDFEAIRSKMKMELAQSGAYLDGEYYCFHHPKAVVEALRIDCDCKKPKPGLLLQAADELRIDLAQSWMVGDRKVDVDAGSRAGARTVLVDNRHLTNNATNDREINTVFVAGSLAEAVYKIISTD